MEENSPPALRRKMRGRVQFANSDRWFFVQQYRWFSSILKILTIIRPETLVRWHRAGFLSYWRWKSRPQGGRPQIHTERRSVGGASAETQAPKKPAKKSKKASAGQKEMLMPIAGKKAAKEAAEKKSATRSQRKSA